MKYVIDRFEGDYAVLENQTTGELENWEKSKIPIAAQEGDLLQLFDDTLVKINGSDQAARIAEKMNSLFD